jgi:hypothetical protein
MPLLSILMLVTQTWRQIVPLLPRFRIVTVSMQRLQVRKERITIATVVMVYLDPFTLRGSVNPLLGGVSNVDIDGNNSLYINAIGDTISTFETLPAFGGGRHVTALSSMRCLASHFRGQALYFGTLPLTHGFTLQNTGPTSAYPGHYPRP